VRRIKKDRISGADHRDRALYTKLRDYMIRVDDVPYCQSCRTRFEVPSHQSLVFLQEGERQPKFLMESAWIPHRDAIF
jgi:hypothetical protein